MTDTQAVPLTPEEEATLRAIVAKHSANGIMVELGPTPPNIAHELGLVLEVLPRLLATLDRDRRDRQASEDSAVAAIADARAAALIQGAEDALTIQEALDRHDAARSVVPERDRGLHPDGVAREHYAKDRHFYEGDGEGPCSVCGEMQDTDFLRITVHFNDGDG